jgi:hypothetical protein
MSKSDLLKNNLEEVRINELEAGINILFGALAPDELDVLAQSYETSTMQMLEIIDTRKKSMTAMDLNTDVEFNAVLFPAELRPLLRRHDVFLAMIGRRDDRWHVLYMSPLYREFTL